MAVIGVLHLLVMYAITNVAAARHLRRGGSRWALAAPLLGATR